MKVFSSGSCRLLTTLKNGYEKIEPIHSMFYNFVGVNFLGKLHNVKQHIQFIKWINDEIELPQDILNCFLTSCSNISSGIGIIEDKNTIILKKNKIKKSFNECDCFIFEICSLKLYQKNGYQVQFELTDDYICIIQTETDLYNDLIELCELIPKEKKIIFQIHFRPNIIYNDDTKIIDKREILYNVINKFCNMNVNIYLYDPSVLLRMDNSLLHDDTHFNHLGYELSFKYLYENFINN